MNTLTLVTLVATEWAAAPGIALPGSVGHPAPASYTRGLEASAQQRSPGKLRRLVDRARRMPKHTKIVLGLVTAGVVVFFVGVWVKSRL